MTSELPEISAAREPPLNALEVAVMSPIDCLPNECQMHVPMPTIDVFDFPDFPELNIMDIDFSATSQKQEACTQTDFKELSLDGRLLLAVDSVREEYPLHWSVRYNNDKNLLSIIRSGKRSIDEVDDLGRTASQIAVVLQRHQCLLILLQYKCNVNQKDMFNNTLSHIAVKNGDKVSLILLNSCAPDYHILNRMGEPVAFTAFEADDENLVKLVWDLTEPKSFLIGLKDSFSFSYLHRAVMHGDIQAAKRYINLAGKDNNILTTNSGQTALHVACELNHSEMVKLILQYQPGQINCRDWQGRLPINLVTSEEIISCLQLISGNL